jgi:hypothetical protein
MSYVYNQDYKDMFYRLSVTILGEEITERFRNYIVTTMTSMLELPIAIKKAMDRRITLFGNRDTRKHFDEVTIKALTERRKEILEARKNHIREDTPIHRVKHEMSDFIRQPKPYGTQVYSKPPAFNIGNK